MADPVDISELTSEGIGKGVGAGVTTGVITGGGGGGGGGGATWARADVDAAARASPKTIVAAVMGLGPTPQRSLARENHDEQRMNAFPKTERQLDKNAKKSPSAGPICPQFSWSVNRS
jgi:hypothetical protein